MQDNGEQVQFVTRDNVTLHGTFFAAGQGNGSLPVLICPGTGISQHVYFAFARWLASQGHAVLVFDYRGIGKSRGEVHVRKVQASIHEWGLHDMPAALEWLLVRTGAHRASLVGHSAGGGLVGLMDNHERLHKVVAVASSIGFIEYMPAPFRWQARFFLKWYIPFFATILGYVPMRLIGMGEDLPKGVGKQWARWCSIRGYVANDFNRQISAHFYDTMRTPVSFIGATDDPISTRKNIEHLSDIYSARKDHRIVILDPAHYQLEKIGHATMFSSSRSALWPVMARELVA